MLNRHHTVSGLFAPNRFRRLIELFKLISVLMIES